MLDLTHTDTHGFVYDCFSGQNVIEGIDLGQLTAQDFIGEYERTPVMNQYHEVSISFENNRLYWTNAANVRWNLYWRDEQLWTGADCPYGEQEVGIRYEVIDNTLVITGLVFLNELYVKQTQ